MSGEREKSQGYFFFCPKQLKEKVSFIQEEEDAEEGRLGKEKAVLVWRPVSMK